MPRPLIKFKTDEDGRTFVEFRVEGSPKVLTSNLTTAAELEAGTPLEDVLRIFGELKEDYAELAAEHGWPPLE